MIRYRSFRNDDPPKVFQLFLDAGFGRGAARPESVYEFDAVTFSHPYFDPHGLIVAEEDSRLIGFVHAGFGFQDDRSGIDQSKGVICLVVVAPSHRRQGVGRELMRRAEAYLVESGAATIQVGQSRGFDPFYFGIHGGARPSGVLSSDSDAAPFLQALGYEASSSTVVMQRDVAAGRTPINFRLMNLRRQTEISISDQPPSPSWWWFVHFGNIDSMHFRLLHKTTSEIIASMTVVGLDQYVSVWNERTIGLVDVSVDDAYRGQGYGQTLLNESLRKLRNNLVSRAEIHIPRVNEVAMKAVTAAGFTAIDEAVVYRRPNASSTES